MTARSISLKLLAALCIFSLSGCARLRSLQRQPEIYHPRADGATLLDAALMQARNEDKRVLLNLGANWCSDSQKMHRLLRHDPAIRHEVARHYVVAMVDVNDREGPQRNATLLACFPNALTNGIPALLVLSPNGTWLNTDAAERLHDSDHSFPEKVRAWLSKWTAENQ